MDTVWLPSKVDEDAGPSSQSTSTVVAASNIPARLRVLDEADTAFAQAAAVNERIHSPIELARTHVDCTRMLASRAQPGDSDRARALLHPALTTASELGLVTIERQAQALLSKPAAK